MTRNRTINVLEYISLFLVLSFFFIHNIYLVIFGLIFSIYELNRDLITNYISHYKVEKLLTDEKKQDTLILKEKKEIEASKEESVVSLVETIEELGFIPSKQ